MAKTSTNALTKRFCAQKGYLCDTVQRFYGGKRHDLFGIADSIVVRGLEVVWVQNCSYGSLKAHRDQIDQSEVILALDAAGVRCELWEWRRKKVGRKKLWFLRRQARSSYGGTWDELQDWQGPFDLTPKPKKGKAKRAKFEPTYNLVDTGSGGGLDYAGLISGHGYDS